MKQPDAVLQEIWRVGTRTLDFYAWPVHHLSRFPIKPITTLLHLAVLQHCLRLRALFSLLLAIGIR